MPKRLVKPTIVTGLEALGRGHDLNKLDTFVAGAIQILGPEFPTYVNMSDYLKRRATSIGIDDDGLVRSQEEIEAMKQQQQQMEAMMSMAGPAAGGIGKVVDTSVKETMKQQQQQPEG